MAVPGPGVAGTYLTGVSNAAGNVAVPAGVAANHIILVFLYIESAQAITKPAEFTEAANSPIACTGASAHSQHVYWKRATAGDTGTYAFSWSAAVWREMVAIRYAGCITTGTPLEATNSSQRSSNGTVTPSASGTTTDVDRLLVAGYTNFAGGAWTQPSGWTERVDTGADMGVAETSQAVAGSTGLITATNASSSFETIWLGALIPVPSATPNRGLFF